MRIKKKNAESGRILGRKLARKLSYEELLEATGAGGTTSYCGSGCGCDVYACDCDAPSGGGGGGGGIGPY